MHHVHVYEIISTTLVWVLFGIAIPTLPFNLFLYLYMKQTNYGVCCRLDVYSELDYECEFVQRVREAGCSQDGS